MKVSRRDEQPSHSVPSVTLRLFYLAVLWCHELYKRERKREGRKEREKERERGTEGYRGGEREGKRRGRET